MNTVFFQKIKSALNTEHPTELIGEIVNDYEEIMKLAEWRNNVLMHGKNLKKNQNEINRINKILEESGYFYCTTEFDIDKKVREFFQKM